MANIDRIIRKCVGMAVSINGSQRSEVRDRISEVGMKRKKSELISISFT